MSHARRHLLPEDQPETAFVDGLISRLAGGNDVATRGDENARESSTPGGSETPAVPERTRSTEAAAALSLFEGERGISHSSRLWLTVTPRGQEHPCRGRVQRRGPGILRSDGTATNVA
jgi:hypothetical protein